MSELVHQPKVPKLRFPEFHGEWKLQKGSHAFDNSNTKGEAGLPIYSVTLDKGMVRRDSLDRMMGNDAADTSNLRAQLNDLVYNTMRMWQGAVGRSPEECMVSPAYVVLRPKPDTFAQFFDYWFKRNRSLYLLWAYSHGLTSDRLRLYFDGFCQIPMRLPSRIEQRKIARFLGALDTKIGQLVKRHLALTAYKKGMMQRLFSRELRFTRDDGSPFPDWQEKRLGDLAKFVRGANLSKSDLDQEGEFPAIHYGELFTEYSEIISVIRSKTNRADCTPSISGDVLMPSSDVTPDGLARGSAIKESGVMLGGDINIIRPVETLVSAYLSYWIAGHRKRFMRLVSGTTVKHLYLGDIRAIPILLPHPNEQQKFANFFTALDTKIDAVASQINAMQRFKKGLLQQMFV